MRPSRFRVRQRVVPVLGADQSSQRGQATIGGMASSNRRRAQLLHSADTRSTRFSCRVVRQRRMLSSQEGRGGEEGLSDDGRRPTSCPWRRRGRRREQAFASRAKRGNPRGAGAPAQRRRLRRRTRATSKRDGQAVRWPFSSGWWNGRVALPRALAARRPTAGRKEPRGRLRSDDDARRGRGGRPPQGAARRVGAGERHIDRATVHLRLLR